MEFFNKKEDVIDLQITQFGRHLLSKGLFKPVYYSFFDDNVLYNSSKANLVEQQNDSEQRIKETQIMQPQIAISSLEKEFNTSYEMIMSNQANASTAVLQKTAEKNYALPQPMGTSDINSEYSPSWSVQYLKGRLSGSSNSLNLKEKTGGNNVIVIPQLETNIETKIKTLTDDGAMAEEDVVSPAQTNIAIQNKGDNLVLLKVVESNAAYQKKNFDIEIFEIIEQIEGDKTIEVLRPLSFTKSHDPSPVDPLDAMEEVTPLDNQDYVAHYFDLLVDSEIEPETLCELDPVNQKLGVHADDRAIICQDIINKQQSVSFNIYEEGTGDVPGDIC
tara:strand:+ start:515 stop:1510 length:996 start_codon:yes stop_codon:yes gene_type:complete